MAFSGNIPRVCIGDTLQERSGTTALHSITFVCCSSVIRAEGAIFWHSEDVTPDAIAVIGKEHIQSFHEQQSIDEETLSMKDVEIENIIVKCEGDTDKKSDFDDSCSLTSPKEDPLLLEEVSAEKDSNDDCEAVNEKDSDVPSGNKSIRKNLTGILSQQGLKVGDTTGSGKRRRYPESFACEFCGKTFSGKERAYQFYYHRNREHTHEMVFKCDICRKEFWGDRELLAHRLKHKDQGYICHICGQKFNAKKNLKVHLLVHLSTREHICRYCDKAFRRKDHLVVHERTHTGIRPYQCQLCDSAYPQKHQLKLHMKKCPVLKCNDIKL